MNMKALAINGSPRKNGNTKQLLEMVLDPLSEAGWETELYQLGGKPIAGCKGCWTCAKTKNFECSTKNDAFEEVFPKMLEADAIIIGSPTYFTNVTAEVKALIDRSGVVALCNKSAFHGKIGAAVVAVRRGGGTQVQDMINHMFLMSQMVVPGSTYWNLGMGLDEGDVQKDDEGIRNMNHLGRMIDWLGKSIAPHIDSFPKPGK